MQEPFSERLVNQELAPIAGGPLTGESWRWLAEGEIVAVSAGRVIDSVLA
jgi:hypothetical protein